MSGKSICVESSNEKSICVESSNEVCVISHQNKDEERKNIWKVCKEFFTLSLLFEKKIMVW